MRSLAISALLLLSACEPVNKFFGLSDDNFVESGLEDLIEYETGAQIDLTPDSPNDGFHLYPRKN